VFPVRSDHPTSGTIYYWCLVVVFVSASAMAMVRFRVRKFGSASPGSVLCEEIFDLAEQLQSAGVMRMP